MRYAVQASTFNAQIHVGKVSKAGNSFLDKEEATDMTLVAVARYVEQNFGGGLSASFPGLNLSIEIRVRPLVTGEPDVKPCEPVDCPEITETEIRVEGS